MRNYIHLTTAAKKAGGPVALMVVTAVSGWAVGRSVEAGGRKIFKSTKTRFTKRGIPCSTKGQVFKIRADGEDSNGLKLRSGDEYKVLECDGDAILIEVLNDLNNPYFVSGKFLTTISDFPTEDEPAA